MRIQHFRELHVYQAAFEAAMRIFELSKGWPREERYSLTDQVRRSSRSVCQCIAEAWRKRRYPAHFVSKLSDADAEAAETQAWLDFALRCGYLSEADYQDLDATYERISGGLVRMMSEPEKWCGPASVVSEDTLTYDVGQWPASPNLRRRPLSHSPILPLPHSRPAFTTTPAHRPPAA